jgi:hypothetical protein
MKAMYGLYPNGAAAQQAIVALRAVGLDDADIIVLSAEPREDCAFSRMHSPTRMWWGACGGGLLGLCAAAALVYVTAVSWPINVGGLPTVAWWPNLVVMFEMMMLGAIVATVITLIVGAGLAGLSRGVYDTAVTEGKILVGIERPREGMRLAIRHALQRAGEVRGEGCV